MVTEVRSLLVSADMDVSGYTNAARQKTAADNAMAESSREVGAAQQLVEQKITVTGGSLDRLKMRYIEGERAARDMAKTVDQVSRGFASGRISAQEAEQVLQGVVRTYGRTIDASAAVARGQAELATAAANVNTAFRQQQVAAETQKLERSATALRAEIDPLGASQAQLNAKLAEYRTLLAGGVISTDEFAKAQAAAQAKHDAFAKSLSGGRGVNAMGATMAAYQFQDIATQAVGGASIGTIALQQGPQLAMALGEGGAAGAVKTLGAGLAALVSPANLVAIGLTAAGAAAIQYFTSAAAGAKSTEDIIKSQADAVKELSETWGVATTQAKTYSEAQKIMAQNNATSGLADTQSQQLKAFAALNAKFFEYGVGKQYNNIPGFAEQFGKVFDDLERSIRNGSANVDDFVTSIKRIDDAQPGFAKIGNEFIKLADDLLKLNSEAKKTVDIMAQISLQGSKLDPLNVFGQARDNTDAARLANTPSLYQQNQNNLEAYKLNLYARSPQEKAAAARAQASAEVNPNESSTARAYRIELAAQQAQLAAEKQLADAQRDRQLGLDAEIESAKQQISLIGKTGGELVGLQKRYEMIAELKREAARNGTQVDEREIELIKQKTAELGRLADQQSRARLSNDLGQQWKALGRTAQENQVAGTLQQYNLPDDLSSPEAAKIRNLISAQQMKGDLTTFFTDFRTELVNNGGDLGKALMTSLQNAAMNQLNRLWDHVFDQLGNSLIKSIFGGADNSSPNGFGGIGDTIAKAITGGVANDNGSGASSGSLMSVYAQAIKNMESGGGNYGALGPITASGDRAYGAYQVMGSNIPSWTKAALGYSMTPSQFLASNSAQDAVFSNRFGGYIGKYGNAGDAASAWFTGRPLSQGANASDLFGTTGSKYVSMFNENVQKASSSVGNLTSGFNSVTNSVGMAANGLGSLGNGLNTFSGQLANILKTGGAGTGGSWFDDLLGNVGKMMGGISPTSSLWRPNTTLGSFLANGFADGGFTGSRPETAIAGVVHGGEYVFSKRATDRLGISTLDELHRRAKGYSDGGYVGSAAANANMPSAGNGRVQVNIINNNGSQVSQQARQTPDGMQLDVMIDEAVAKKISTPGSGTRRAMTSQFGLGGTLARR